MPLILVPHANCIPKYFFGCNDDAKQTIKSFEDELYSVEDCYRLCLETTSCVGFDFGPAQHCILKEKECSNDPQKTTSGFYYSMDKCKRCTFSNVLSIQHTCNIFRFDVLTI